MLGEPVVGMEFRGRDALLRDLLRHARKAPVRRRHLVLTSPPKAGQTSLLMAFAGALRSRTERVVWIEGHPGSREDLFHQFLWGMAGAATPPGRTAADSRMDLPDLVRRFPKRFSLLGRDLLDLHERAAIQGADAALFERAFLLLNICQKATRSTLWILVDHSEYLMSCLGEPFLAGPFRNILSRNRRIRWLLAGTPPSILDRLCQGRRAPLAGLAETFSFRGLAYQESLQLLEHYRAAASLPPAYRTFLVALTGGLPFYLDLLAHEMESLPRDRGRRSCPERLLLEAFSRSLFARGGRLHLYFRAFLLETFHGWRAPDLYRGMLEAVAQGQSSLVGMAASIGREAPALSRQVQNLLDSGILAKEGTRYFIPDPLFRFWLRHVHLARRGSSDPNQSGLDLFRERLREMLGEFLGSLDAETVRRLARILASSDGKAPLPSPIPPDGDEPLLETVPRFDQVEIRQKLAEESFDLVARRRNEYWAFAVHDAPPSESCLIEFAERIERVRSEIPQDQRVRPVLLVLVGLPRSVARAAGRLRLAVWTREGLNRLAECYDQLPLLG
jgi:hypothetical protein